MSSLLSYTIAVSFGCECMAKCTPCQFWRTNSYPHRPSIGACSSTLILICPLLTGEAVANKTKYGALRDAIRLADKQTEGIVNQKPAVSDAEGSTLGSRLRWAAIEVCGTVMEFSFTARIPDRNLQRYFAGTTMPSVDALENIQYAGISIDWLISGQGCAFRPSYKFIMEARETEPRCCQGEFPCPHGLPSPTDTDN